MIINTDVLSDRLNELDDRLFPGMDWDTCRMSFLETREKIAIKHQETIEAIECLEKYFQRIFKSPSFDMEKLVSVMDTACKPRKISRQKYK